MADGSNDSGAGLTNLTFPVGVVLFPAPYSNIQVGDVVTCSAVAGNFTCSNVSDYTDPTSGIAYKAIHLTGFSWPALAVPASGLAALTATSRQSATFTRAASALSIQSNYVVAQNVLASTSAAPVNVIPLTYVTGLVPGDTLVFTPTPTRPSGGSFTVADVDSILNNAITVDPVSVALFANDPLTFDDTTASQVVFQNFNDVIVKANDLSTTDLSRFNPMVAPDPVLTWIAPRVTLGTTGVIYCPQNLQPNLTGVDIATANNAMISGTPESGWTGASSFIARVNWTDQLTAAPSSLMTDLSASLAPNAWPSNRNGALERSPAYALTEVQTAYNGTAIQTIVHDYSGMRRILTTLSGSTVTATSYTWNGSTWSGSTVRTWTGAAPNCGVPFPPVPSSLGSGASILYLDNTNVLRIMFGTSSASLALNAAQKSSLLVQTAYGAYLVSQTGYGLITWTGSALVLNWQPLTMAGIWLLPTTFTALDANDVYVLAVVQTWDSASAKYAYGVYDYHLAAVPVAPATAAPDVVITASISGSSLIVTATSATITANMLLSTTNVNLPNTLYIISQASGTPGGIGTYNLSASTSTGSSTMTLSLGGSYPSILDDPEMICSGIPSIITAIKDPSSSRIFGLIGSRMFQISKVSSGVIERYCVDGMTAQQLIENVAMIQNAYVCPLPDGQLHIVSRNQSESAVNVTVVILKSKTVLASEYFISQVNVSGDDDAIYAQQAGALGGLTLEIDNAFLTTCSQCRAVAASYLQFFGSGKPVVDQEWTWTGTGAAPWETFVPSQTITVNGLPQLYLVVGLDYSLMEPKATVKLLEI